MTTATFTGFPLWTRAADRPADVRPAPPPRRRQPVFIHDAITPWNGETLLLTLLRAQAPDEDQP